MLRGLNEKQRRNIICACFGGIMQYKNGEIYPVGFIWKLSFLIKGGIRTEGSLCCEMESLLSQIR